MIWVISLYGSSREGHIACLGLAVLVKKLLTLLKNVPEEIHRPLSCVDIFAI